MISGIFGSVTGILTIIYAIKGETTHAIGSLIATGIFWCSWNVSNLTTEIQKIRKLYEDKILAEKTLSLVMRAAQESSGQ